ncbi:hypothetical protein OPT61_g9683 [Boeremia exigua]|uniref:Uncharacterized protein n=1 Tax=Boeremia exigua TaxID=749465 RepID=A0ACC2HU16_9PLEO|nr:hypothetical protein OPT61_g9683 [Boeremia exigua]
MADIKVVTEAESLEVAHGELGETLLVECRLKVLSGQSTGIVSASMCVVEMSTYNWRMSTSLRVDIAAAGAAGVGAIEEEADEEDA